VKSFFQKAMPAFITVGVLIAMWALFCSPRKYTRIVTPFSFGLTPSLQYPKNETVSVYGLRAGVWMNEFGECPETVASDVHGASIGLFAMKDETLNGVQLSGLMNSARTLNGVQIASLSNYSSKVNGVQMGLINTVLGWGEVSGVQLGLSNKGRDVLGVQAGLVNTARIDSQKRGFLRGTQVGLANFAEGSAHGVQLGVYNQAQTLKGVQIGLLNRRGERYFPVLMIGR